MICTFQVPQWLSGEESVCSAGATGDVGSIPGSGRSPGGGLIYIYNMPMRQALLLFSNKKNLKYKKLD